MSIGKVRLDRAVQVAAGSIGRWVFPKRASVQDRFRAPACDDLAGVAAALAALDRCRAMPELGHFGVLLTRAEEVGLVGAIHAAREGSIPDNSRMLSIETSRELPNARIGDGPIIRVGDAVTIFDAELTNRIAAGARGAGIKHQRKLMDGGGCEATAFAAYGYQSSGLCLALGNWHNRGNLEAVEAGTGRATPELEEISLEDFHDLVRLLLVAAESADHPVGSRSELERSYQRSRRYLG